MENLYMSMMLKTSRSIMLSRLDTLIKECTRVAEESDLKDKQFGKIFVDHQEGNIKLVCSDSMATKILSSVATAIAIAYII